MLLHPVDLTIIILYLAAMLALGFYFSKKSKSTEHFMAAGRSLPGWVVGLSIFGTFLSSISYIANPGKSFAENWAPFVFGLSLPIAAFVATRYFIPFFRAHGEISAYHHLEKRFGPWARTYAVICYLLTQLGRIGTILYLVALALAPIVFGQSSDPTESFYQLTTIIIIAGVLVTAYTVIGGIETVIWTDVIQSIVLTLGMILVLFTIFFSMPQGPLQVFQIANDADKFSLGDFHISFQDLSFFQNSTFWLILIYGLFINLQNFGIDQSYVQRYAAAKSEAEAKKSVWLGALLYIPLSAFLFLIGTALFAYYHPTAGHTDPDTVAHVASAATLASDEVFPHFIASQLPLGTTGLLLAAIFAAAMSSVDTSLNSSATLTLKDLYTRYINPNATEKTSLKVLHLATLIFGILGTITAILMIGNKSALDTWWKIAGIFSGGILGLFLLGLIIKKTTSPAAAIAVTLGVIVISYITYINFNLPNGEKAPIHSYFATILGTLTIFLTGFLITLFVPRSNTQPQSDKPRD